jgi:hypothetical protein
MVSITVWERLVLMTLARSVLMAMVGAAGVFPESPLSILPEFFNDMNKCDKSYYSLDEVNLLKGLSLGTPFYSFPTTHSLHIVPTLVVGTHTILSLPPQYTNQHQGS